MIGLNGRSSAAALNGNGVPGSGSYLGRVDGDLGFMRSYIASAIGAHKTHVSDVSYILGNPKFLRLFSSEAPKKKSEQVYIFFFNCFVLVWFGCLSSMNAIALRKVLWEIFFMCCVVLCWCCRF